MSSFKVKVLSSLNCYLLQVDESTILLDCGWNENLDVDELGELKSVVKQIDTVLISHGDISHMGAYAYAVKMGLDCPCYGTTPTHDLGGTMLSDIIKSQRENQDFQLFTAADVDSAMSKWQILRYSQPFSLQDKCQGIVITAFGAGHSIGGTLWRIKKDSENVIYSIDYNLRKERHLNGSVLVTNDSLSKPSLLITDAQNTLYPIPPARKERDKSLISTIKDTLQSQGNVLIPVDSTTRVLELIYLLDQQWAFDKIPHHLVFLSHESIKTVNFARSMLEWMGDGISQAFAARELPFDLKNLKILTSMAEFDSLKGPKVVLASSPGLMFGFSRELFIQWSSDPKNTIILPDKGYGNSLSRKLYEMWDEKSPKETQVREPVPIELDQEIEWGVRVPLDGEELIAFQEEESKRNVLEDAARQKTVDSDSDMSDAEEDVEEAEFSQSFDIFLKAQKIKDADAGFFKQQQAFKMFPIYEVRHKIDDYGELIDLADFKKFETKPLQQVEMEIDEPKLEAPKEKPCKYIQQNLSVQSRCKVHYIDFEGRSDSKTVKNIIEHVLPKRLV
jgi:cleavage and polyadenylation specificity factor subunit 2